MTFPDHFINPNEKNKEWYLQTGKAAVEEWEHLVTDSFLKGASRYNINRRYSIGNPPTNQHMDITQSDDDSEDNKSYQNIDWSPLAVIPKIRRAALGRLSKIPDEIHVDAIDPLAQVDKQNYEKTERANIKARGIAQTFGVDPGVLSSGELDQPQTEEELTMKMEFSYQHNMAIDTEKQIKTVFTANKIKQLRDRIRMDLFDYGVAGYRDWTEPDGTVKMRVIHPGRLIVSPTEDPYFGDLWYVGEIKLMTVKDVRKIAGDSISKDEYEQIQTRYETASDFSRQQGVENKFLKGHDGYMIPVLELEFVTVDEEVYERRTDKFGNKRTGRVKHDYKNKKRKGREYETSETDKVCQLSYILNTDVIFDYGPAYDTTQKPGAPWYAKPSYHIVSPELHEMETIAITDHIKPIIEMVQGLWLKLQNAIAQARPRGLYIDLASLQSVSLGKGYEDMQPIDLVDMYSQSGIMVGRTVDPLTGNLSMSKPIEELEGGMGNYAKELFDLIQGTMGWLGSIVGLNDFTDGSTPDPRSLNGVASMAIEGTRNALKFLADAERDLLERVADSVAVRIHDSIHLKGSKVYANTLGTAGLKSLGEKEAQVFREYGLTVVDRGDQFERERLAMRIDLSVKNNQITIADAVAIENVTNLKQQEMMLAYKVKKNQEVLAAQKQADIENNGKIQQESAMATEKAKQESEVNKGEVEIDVFAANEAEKRETLELQHKLKMEELGLQNEGKIDVQEEASDGAIDKQEITNEGLIASAKEHSKNSNSKNKNASVVS